jgi:hypothetical protein
MRQGQLGQRSDMHFPTSLGDPAQQSRQCARIAAVADIGS